MKRYLRKMIYEEKSERAKLFHFKYVSMYIDILRPTFRAMLPKIKVRVYVCSPSHSAIWHSKPSYELTS